MTARDDILSRVSLALEDLPTLAPSSSPVPWTYAVAAEVADRAALFVERLQDYSADATRVSAGGVADAVAAALAGARRIAVPVGLPAHWLIRLRGVEVITDDGGMTVAELDAVDAVLTAAAIGIAVTGTIVLDHGSDQGRRALSLLPDLHVCVLRAEQLVGDVPEAIARLRPAAAAGQPLTWVSGPSATSDIELSRVEGVHGPRTLRVILSE